jgi:hypothetical protein
MSSIDWDKLDKFYIVFLVVLIALSTLIVVAVRGVFSAYITAYEIDQGALDAGLKVDNNGLDEVYTWAFNKGSTPLRQ